VTESDKTEVEQTEQHQRQHLPFGEGLFAARKSKGLSIAEIAKSIHLSKDVIDAIEQSDVERLPQPIFVQGYLRAYAKYLDLDETRILEQYSEAVPHSLETELHPRSLLPSEADSGSPFVKSISILLVILMVLAAVYGVFNYYSEMFETSRTEIDQDDAEDLVLVIPEYDISMEDSALWSEQSSQPASLTNSTSVLPLPAEDEANETASLAQQEPTAAPEPMVKEVPQEKVSAEIVKPQPQLQPQPQPQLKVNPAAPGNDVIELTASEDAWTEVVDANDVGLLYDLVKQNHTVVLKGTAPFDIFLGNAPAMELTVNGIKVGMTKFIRSNKIAQFNVSTSDQQIVFH
jgi:cytoskeleton protein RodZ